VNPRRLYRRRHDRQLAGVASGMAEYLNIDPTVVRILWILSAFLGGFTLVLYIILAFVIPLEPTTMPAPAGWRPAGPAWGMPPAPAAGTGAPGAADPGSESPADSGDPAQGTAAWAAADTAWTAPAASQWSSGIDQRPDDHRGGRAGLFFGVLLVVFGAVALVNVLIPGWVAAGLLWPAFILALGAALLVGSIRRSSSEP